MVVSDAYRVSMPGPQRMTQAIILKFKSFQERKVIVRRAITMRGSPYRFASIYTDWGLVVANPSYRQ